MPSPPRGLQQPSWGRCCRSEFGFCQGRGSLTSAAAPSFPETRLASTPGASWRWFSSSRGKFRSQSPRLPAPVLVPPIARCPPARRSQLSHTTQRQRQPGTSCTRISSHPHLCFSAPRGSGPLVGMRIAGGIIALVLVFHCSCAAGSRSGFVPAPADGDSCPTVCSSTGQNAATLQQFNQPKPVLSHSCAANVTGHGLVPGYQLSGNTTCTVAWGQSVRTSQDFSCLCMEPSASLGMVAADGGSCDYACNQTVDGLSGTAVEPPASVPTAACLPSQDLGKLNRFGHTLPLASGTDLCFSALDGEVYTTATFSCFCLFEAQAELQLPPAQAVPVATGSLATGG